MNEITGKYWRQFLTSLPVDSLYPDRPFSAEGWGSDPEMADELGMLIKDGIKTATCSAQWEWEYDGEQWPAPGHLTIVLNGRDEPLCIIEVTEITIRAFDQVDAQFAFEEGEGDRSLAYWRTVHQQFFQQAMSKIGKHFSEDIPLVCERFRVIYVDELNDPKSVI